MISAVQEILQFGAVAVFLLWIPSRIEPPCFAQSPHGESSKSTLAEVGKELGSRYGEVRFHREETLEDRYVVHGLPISEIGRLPQFFLVQSQRFDTSKGSIRENVSSGLPTMYLASLPNSPNVYKLFGFANAEGEFNRLVGDGPQQKIVAVSDAETRGLLCAETVYGLPPRWWVADPSNAKLMAAEHFFNAGHKNGLQLGEKWWNASKGNRASISVGAAKSGHDSFSINLPIFWAPVESDAGIQIKVYRIDVAESGTCHMNVQPISVLK